jgi:hypothetical protein
VTGALRKRTLDALVIRLSSPAAPACAAASATVTTQMYERVIEAPSDYRSAWSTGIRQAMASLYVEEELGASLLKQYDSVLQGREH